MPAPISPLVRVVTVATIVFAAFGTREAHAQQLLFSDTGNPTLAGPSAGDPRPFLVRSRVVNLNVGVLERALSSPATASFTLNLFDDVVLAVGVERLEETAFGHRSWTGHIVDRPLSAVVLTLKNGEATGRIIDGTIVYEIVPLGGSVHRIESLETSLIPPERDIVLVPPQAGTEEPSVFEQGALAPAVPTVDVQVIYTSVLRQQVGEAQVQSRIAQYIAESNLAFQRSGVNGRLRLVGADEMPFPDPAPGGAALDALRTSVAAQSRRDALQADLVALLVFRMTDACGIGYVNASGPFAYSVSESSSMCVMTFVHEIGHNLGAQHADDDPIVTSPSFPTYARGYKALDHAFRTVMAYPCTTPPVCPRILNFSNPTVLEGGQLTGTSVARNADRLNELFPVVAAFRAGAPPPSLPPPPTAADDAYSTPQNTRLTVAAPGVLANDDSQGGGALYATLSGNVSHGVLSFANDGSFIYTPTTGYVGPDTFAYRAASGGGHSSVATVAISVQAPASAEPPTDLVASSIVGNIVTLQWKASAGGLAPTGYVVEGGVNPGQVIATVATNSTAPTFTFPAATGAFYLRVHTLSGVSRSGPSNEIRIFVGVPAPPSPPTNLLGLVNGSSLALSWMNTSMGGPPTRNILDVTGAFVGSVSLPVSETFTVSGVPPGTYTFAVRAANATGESTASTPITLTFPDVCSGAPLAPRQLTVSRIGGVATLSWLPPASGPAATGYTLIVSGAFTGSFPLTARTISGPVGSGTYTFSVAATNACETGPATPPETLTVPLDCVSSAIFLDDRGPSTAVPGNCPSLPCAARTIQLTATSNACTWSVSNLPAWLQIDGGNSPRYGSSNVRMSVVQNNPTGATRTAVFEVGGKSLSVTQCAGTCQQ